MPGQYDTGSPAGGAAAARQPQHRPSRRSVLLSAAGAGAAGIAATALAGTAAPALAVADRPAAQAARGTDAGAGDGRIAEQIVVHVRDAAAGEIDVFRGTSQVRLRDRELAARLVRATR
jgi:hypothetical protein